MFQYTISYTYTQAPNGSSDEAMSDAQEAEPVLERYPDYTVCLLLCMARDVKAFVQANGGEVTKADLVTVSDSIQLNVVYII